MVVVVIICILPNHLDIDMYWLISLWNIFIITLYIIT